jgi:outer membrane receptor protein involved in Fe transport
MKTLIRMNTVFGKTTRVIQCALFIILCILFASLSTALAEETETDQETLDAIDEEIRWLEAETYVITPSKIPETIKKTAASITVVTDRQIRQMGAKNLNDVIERVVPSFWGFNGMGWHILITREPRESGVLMMINGLPFYDAYDQSLAYEKYTVLNMDNIKRIEFVRGPGSALYGANAYHGVINIITKKAEDVDGVELTARGGSWDTQQYNLLFGKSFNDLEVTFNFNYFKTHGNSALIKEDYASAIDQEWYAPLGYPPMSLTPGYTKEHEEKYELSLNLKYKGFIFDGGYLDRQSSRPVNSSNFNLTEKSIWGPETYYLNLGYETTLVEKLDLSAKVYGFLEEFIEDKQIFPPGYVRLSDSGSSDTIWPEGMFWLDKFKTSRMGMEIQSTYRISDSNTIVAGATYEEQKFYDDENWNNEEYLPDSDTWIPSPTMQKLPDSIPSFIPDQKNDFKALFLEDVWGITGDLRLTLGAHYIDYSSFGGHFSPRAGLTWEYIKGYDLKLLYGHAFSIPSIDHIVRHFPGTTTGPQTIDTYEISLGAKFTPSFESRITLFQNNDKDLIIWQWPESGFDSGWANLGESRSQGVEVEARYDFGRGTYIAGNYSYTDIDTGDVPRIYLGKIMSNIRLSRYLNLFVDGYYIGGWNEGADLYLESAANRVIVNATLIARNFLKGCEGLELRGSVYNLFDEEWAEYSGLFVTDGWPQPGINFLVEVRYKF